jgi:hypothetical protein
LEISVSAAELASRRLMIGTPMYEGMCHGAYAAALVEIALKLGQHGVAFSLSFIVNQPTDRGRCMVIDEFLTAPTCCFSTPTWWCAPTTFSPCSRCRAMPRNTT